ncbi:uncharacterized protein ARMOST_07734 [Armillaria ostoyae]|uniref:Uncharacterized protein n=1 Tax=Armillaria ostoyae TaxID=47428 RepID=A0A284R6L7_ARMOS|nr:uncharacterized protein ARMOST_07734 [Armillaria ostoyae]
MYDTQRFRGHRKPTLRVGPANLASQPQLIAPLPSPQPLQPRTSDILHSALTSRRAELLRATDGRLRLRSLSNVY